MITAAQVPSYDQIKHTLLNYKVLKEGRALHFLCSVAAGFIAVMVTNPVDVVKTRVQVQRASYDVASKGKGAATGVYTGPIDCAVKVLKTEGPLGFYKGDFSA